MSLADVMADKQPLWERMVREHGLQEIPFAAVSSWGFGDAVFSWNYDVLADGSKVRRFGFHEHIQTETMFAELVAELRSRRIIP